jgi:hypothetical protein
MMIEQTVDSIFWGIPMPHVFSGLQVCGLGDNVWKISTSVLKNVVCAAY